MVVYLVTFSNIGVVHFIVGGNRSIRRKKRHIATVSNKRYHNTSNVVSSTPPKSWQSNLQLYVIYTQYMLVWFCVIW